MEAGAYDGQDLSNTLALEMKQGWKGLLVEPNPANYKLLEYKHRKAWLAKSCLSIEKYPKQVRPDKFEKQSLHKVYSYLKFKC